MLPIHFGNEMGLLRHFHSGFCEVATGLEVEGAIKQYLSYVHIGLHPVVLVVETEAFSDLCCLKKTKGVTPTGFWRASFGPEVALRWGNEWSPGP